MQRLYSDYPQTDMNWTITLQHRNDVLHAVLADMLQAVQFSAVSWLVSEEFYGKFENCCCSVVVRWGLGPFENPEERKRPPLKAATKQRLGKTEKTLCVPLTHFRSVKLRETVAVIWSYVLWQFNKPDYQSKHRLQALHHVTIYRNPRQKQQHETQCPGV
jgi:hypothetical protein